LADHDIEFESIAVRKQPPSVEELKSACDQLGLKKLFSTAGLEYRKLGLKDLLPEMSEQEALELLAGNGNLVKRPMLFSDKGTLVGFKVDEWEQFFA